VECKTFRAYGHGDHDDDRAAKYRPQDEVEEGRSRDPIAVAKRLLLAKGYISESEATLYQAENKSAGQTTDEDFPPEVVSYVKRGVDYALKSPLPAAEEGAQWVFRV
jgi:TPP-dependent pyruvate/acetoin dehydrogenase alpha subunit